jgi:hypothetical protein
MKTIFEELREDHDLQRELLDILLSTEGNSDARKKVFSELKDQLEAHAKYEERALYNPMLKNDNTQSKARHSISEHKEIDDFIEKLEKTDLSSPSWIATAKKLDERVRHHLEEEEKEIFVSAGIAFSKQQKKSQAQEYRQGMSQN